jgi:polysaccharide export outer membrane protein
LDGQWTPVRVTPRTAVKPDTGAKDAGHIATKPISPTTGDTSLAAPLDRLLVGVGDQIFITVFGQTDMSAEVTVNDNSQVTLPLIGTLTVGGLTPPAIEKLIAQRLRDGEYLRNPEVSVQVKQVRSQMISVLGEVQRPGRFPILGKLTVLDALATAGGLGPKADRTVFLLRRNPVRGGDSQRLEIAIKLDQVIDAGRGELDVELKNDDVVFVAQQKLFYIHGEVRRPGAYPMEADLDVMRVLSLSGGVTERGSLRRIRILRKDADQKTQEISATLNSPVMGGDVVYVDERFF